MASTPKGNEVATNGVAAVTAVPAPSSSSIQHVIGIKDVVVHNHDTIDHTVIFQKNKGGTITIIARVQAIKDGAALLPKLVVLDATNETLEVLLAEAIATNNPRADAAYLEVS